jgi:hypothetical protein
MFCLNFGDCHPCKLRCCANRISEEIQVPPSSDSHFVDGSTAIGLAFVPLILRHTIASVVQSFYPHTDGRYFNFRKYPLPFGLLNSKPSYRLRIRQQYVERQVCGMPIFGNLIRRADAQTKKGNGAILHSYHLSLIATLVFGLN